MEFRQVQRMGNTAPTFQLPIRFQLWDSLLDFQVSLQELPKFYSHANSPPEPPPSPPPNLPTLQKTRTPSPRCTYATSPHSGCQRLQAKRTHTFFLPAYQVGARSCKRPQFCKEPSHSPRPRHAPRGSTLPAPPLAVAPRGARGAHAHEEPARGPAPSLQPRAQFPSAPLLTDARVTPAANQRPPFGAMPIKGSGWAEGAPLQRGSRREVMEGAWQGPGVKRASNNSQPAAKRRNAA